MSVASERGFSRRKRNRGYLGHDASALPAQDLQVNNDRHAERAVPMLTPFVLSF
jgi:hypothetical protein